MLLACGTAFSQYFPSVAVSRRMGMLIPAARIWRIQPGEPGGWLHMKTKFGVGFVDLIRVIVAAIDVSWLERVSVPTIPPDPASPVIRFLKPLHTSPS